MELRKKTSVFILNFKKILLWRREKRHQLSAIKKFYSNFNWIELELLRKALLLTLFL